MEFDFGFGSKTIYLVDSENLNDAWVKAIDDLGSRDQIFVFYTENSANMSVASISQLTARENQVIWKRCFTGTNALDFQLVSQLGALIARHPRDTFVILSNDTGYDPVVRYWTVEGIKISRTSVQTGTPRARRTSRGGVRYSSRNQNRSTPPAYLAQAKKPAKPDAPANAAPTKNAAESGADRTKAAASAKEQKRADAAVNAAVPQETARTSAEGNGKPSRGSRTQTQQKSDAPKNDVPKTETPKDEALKTTGAGLSEVTEEKAAKSKKAKADKVKPEDGEKKKKKKKDKTKKQDASAPEPAEIVAKTPEEVALELTAVSAETVLPPVFDGEGRLHPGVAAFIDALGAALPAKGLGEYHEALVHVLGSEDGNAAYQMLRGDREWQQRLSGRLLDGRDERADAFVGAFLSYLGYPADDADRIKAIIFEGNATNYAGLYRSFVHNFGATRGRQYYSLFKSSLKTIQQL